MTSAADFSSVLLLRDNKVSIGSMSYKLIMQIEELSNQCNRAEKTALTKGTEQGALFR